MSFTAFYVTPTALSPPSTLQARADRPSWALSQLTLMWKAQAPGSISTTTARNTDLFAPAMARLRRLIRRVRLAPWFARKPASALRAKSQDPATTRPASLTVLYAIQAGGSGPSTRPEQELAQ